MDEGQKEQNYLRLYHKMQELKSSIYRLEKFIVTIKGEADKKIQTAVETPPEPEPSLVGIITIGADSIEKMIMRIEKAREELESLLLG